MSELVTMIVGVAGKILDKLIPDPIAKAKAQLDLLALAQAGELAHLEAEVKTALGQMDINRTEAASQNIFVSGWRPSVGWVCSAGLAYQFLLQPLLAWFSGMGHGIAPPSLQLQDLMAVLTGILGLGTMRTVEKAKGVV